jgi:hypothetical protein
VAWQTSGAAIEVHRLKGRELIEGIVRMILPGANR